MFDIVLQLSCSYIAGVIIYILTTLIAEVARAREIQGKITSYVRIIRSHLTFNKDFEELYKNITELDQYLEKATSSEN